MRRRDAPIVNEIVAFLASRSAGTLGYVHGDLLEHLDGYDHGSTDRSVELLTNHRNVVLGRFEVTGGSFVRAATEHYNSCWKQSRGVADWVFVVNVDELLYHPRLRAYLRACTRLGVSVIVPEGYNMVSDTFPTSRKPLWSTIRYGARDPIWDKPQFFDPNRVEQHDEHDDAMHTMMGLD